MNGNVNINLAKKTMEITATVASIEDAGAAIDALKAGARALWPAIVFEGEPGFAEAVADAEDEGAAETGSEPRKALPKPGGYEPGRREAAHILRAGRAGGAARGQDSDRDRGRTRREDASRRRGSRQTA